MMLRNDDGEDIVGDNWGVFGGGVGSVVPYERYVGTVPRYRTPSVDFGPTTVWVRGIVGCSPTYCAQRAQNGLG
jgi:hypothetical protein